MTALRLTLLAALFLGAAGRTRADDPPSYANQVKPFLAKYCLQCHNDGRARGQVNVASHATLLKTGRKSRPAVVPGEPDKSRLVLTTEGKARPPMPPRKAKQPDADEKGLLRAWIAAGAKDDTKAAGAGAAPRPAPPEVGDTPESEGAVPEPLVFLPLGLLGAAVSVSRVAGVRRKNSP